MFGEQRFGHSIVMLVNPYDGFVKITQLSHKFFDLFFSLIQLILKRIYFLFDLFLNKKLHVVVVFF